MDYKDYIVLADKTSKTNLKMPQDGIEFKVGNWKCESSNYQGYHMLFCTSPRTQIIKLDITNQKIISICGRASFEDVIGLLTDIEQFQEFVEKD